MNIHQSAIPILIVIAPLLAALILPLLDMWKRSLVYPLTLGALAFSFAASIVAAREVLTNGPIDYYMGDGNRPGGLRSVLTI